MCYTINMQFNKLKSDFLNKKDKSKKGHVDKDIINLVNKINNSKNYYTTSSCSGRIVLLALSSGKKGSKWLFKSHSYVNFSQIKKSLTKLPKTDVWLRSEGAIFHIACRNIIDAQQLVNKARSVGFKRSGIQATHKKIIVEIASSEYIYAIIAKNGRLVVDEGYIRVLINEANKKLKANKEKLRKFYDSVKRAGKD